MVVRPHIAVVGGGISGLTTAYRLCQTTSAKITLIEADRRLGGKVYTRHLLDVPVDVGPDTISARSPQLRDLIDELGLSGAMVAPGVTGSYLWSRGRLRRVPTGPLFGLSGRPWPLLRSGLLSPAGVVRAALDLVAPRTPLPADPSVGEIVRARFGDQVCERLVEPMLAGANGGQIDELSAGSVAPEIAALARANRSLYLALRRQYVGAAPSGPAFTTLEGGLGRLIDALATAVASCDVRPGTAVTALEPAADGYLLRLDPGPPLEVDSVVLAVPAYVAADLLEAISPAIASALRGVRYGNITSVTLAYPHDAIVRPLDATGFLVPPAERRLLTGCTWLAAKWPPLAGHTVSPIRCLITGQGDAAAAVSDDVLAGQVHEELVEAMGVAAPPAQVLVQRWSRAIPQYTVGHQNRLDRIDGALRALPGIHLTGAGYRGASLAACVAQGEETARSVAAGLAPLQRQGGMLR